MFCIFLIASHAGDITAAYSIVICVVLHRTLGISPQHGRLRHLPFWLGVGPQHGHREKFEQGVGFLLPGAGLLLPLLGFGPHVFSRVPGGGPRYFEQGAGFLLPGTGLLLPLPDMLGHRPQHRLVRIRGGRHPRYGLLHHTRGGGPQRGHVRRMLGVHPPHLRADRICLASGQPALGVHVSNEGPRCVSSA